MTKPIYCISGLGTDEKIFDNLRLDGYELKFIPWIKPGKTESITEYATRMASYITDELPVLLGVSFGGMMGIEIAKQVPIQKLILVSSIKSPLEMPKWMRVAGKMRLNKIIPIRSYKFTEKIDNRRLGVSNEQELLMVRDYRQKADPVYLEWAVHQVLNWRNNWLPDNLVHIHGDMDKIFPIKKTTPTHVIKAGTHMIIYNRAKEIAECIEKELTHY